MENVVISKQKEELFDKNKEITDSINYAKRIQSSLIPKENEFTRSFKDSFVLFKPKDIVSGDFYWIYEKDNKIYYATADCTGHGVPGGFMTMLGLTFLEEIVSLNVAQNPADILNIIRDKIKMKLTYAAANNSFYILRKDEKTEWALLENKGDKQPCGFFPDPQPFTLREVELKKDDIIYTLTDGYPDQFGGKTKEIRKAGGKKFRYKTLEMLLIQNCELPFAKQKELLNTAIIDWMGELDQVDDILVIGVKI